MRTADGYLVDRCLNGDPAAFGLLVDKYKEGVYALAYSKLRNFHDAEDVTQEVFIKAYQKLRTLRRWDNFHAWIYAIASNLCKDWIRERSRRPDREFIEDQAPRALEGYSIDSHRENQLIDLLHEALDSLPETYRQVLTLYYLGGMNGKEIAEFLGMSPTAIWQRLSRARSQLKEEIFAKMSTAFKERRLRAGFTFRIVEAVKRVKVHPMPRATGLPWGLSLTAGIVIVLMSLSPHLSLLNSSSFLTGSPLPAEAKVLETGQIPVDILEISRIPALASKQLDRSDMPTASTLSTSAEAAEDAKGAIDHPAEGQGHYMMGCYAEMPGKGEFARGWFELVASDSGFVLGSDNTIGFPTTRQEAPAPWYMLFRYVTHPLRRVRLPTRVGDKWSAGHGWRLKADTVVESNKDAVTVPAGTFRDCLKLKTVIFDGEIQPQDKRDFVNGTRYMWFAPGVGLVKLKYYHNDDTTTNIELVSYSVSEKDYEWYFPLDPGNRWTYDWTNRYWHYKVRETCAIISANPSTVKVCTYLRRNEEHSYSRDEIKEVCNLSDEELDAAVELLVEWQFAEWKDGRLTSGMEDWSASVVRRFAR